MGLIRLSTVFCILCQQLLTGDQCQVTGRVYVVLIMLLLLSELDFSTKRVQKRKDCSDFLLF